MVTKRVDQEDCYLDAPFSAQSPDDSGRGGIALSEEYEGGIVVERGRPL